MARFVILLLLFIGTPLLAQTITTPVEESFPHTHIRAQAYGFSYPNEFQNKSIETRYRLTFKRAFRPYEGFQYAYHVDLWGLFPREAEDLFDFPEAYLSYRASPLTLKLGRILPEWGTVPFYSPVKRIFSKFSIDHLSYQRDGLLGLQAAYHQRRFSYELFWSPAFIPDRGGFRMAEDNQGYFYAPSRWGPVLPYRVKIGSAWVPLDYTLYIPKVKDFISHTGFAGRIQYKAPRFTFSLIAANLYNPEPRVKYFDELHIQNESNLSGTVRLFPGYYRMTTLAAESKYQWDWGTFFGESAFFYHDNPKGPDGIIDELYRSPQLRSTAGISTDWKRQWVPDIILGAVNIWTLDEPYSQPVTRVDKDPIHFYSRLQLSPLPWFTYSVFAESNVRRDDVLVSSSVQFSPLPQLKASVGLDLIAGNQSTYWGQYREHDRVWTRIRYDF